MDVPSVAEREIIAMGITMSKVIAIPGCTMDLRPNDKPSFNIYGAEGSGKTRFAATAPGPIGLLQLDKKARRTFHEIAGELGTDVIVNEKPFMSDKDAITMALTDGDSDPKALALIKTTYTDVVKRVLETALVFAGHPDIQTVVIDTCSQLFDWILMSYFGRRNQISPLSRSGPNQDLIDLINALRSRNLVLIHRAKEIWKPTGQYDKQGNAIKEPSGKYESDGFRHVGGYVTATIELTNKRVKTAELANKFRAKIITSQSNCLMEGQDLHDYGISGEAITWDNIITILGLLDE